MADIDFGTGPGTGDTVRQALEKLQARIDALQNGGGGGQNPAPVFVVQPSITPTSGVAGTTFTANDGQASNATSYSRRWLLDGTSIGTGTTVVPVVAGSLVLEVTAENTAGMATATSGAVTVTASGGGTPTPTPTPGTGAPIGGTNIGTLATSGPENGMTLVYGDDFDGPLDLMGPAPSRRFGRYATTRGNYLINDAGQQPRASTGLGGVDSDPLWTGNLDSNRGRPVASMSDMIVQSGGKISLRQRDMVSGEAAQVPINNQNVLSSMMHTAFDVLFRAPFVIKWREQRFANNRDHMTAWFMQNMGFTRDDAELDVEAASKKDGSGDGRQIEFNNNIWVGTNRSSARSSGSNPITVDYTTPKTYALQATDAGVVNYYLEDQLRSTMDTEGTKVLGAAYHFVLSNHMYNVTRPSGVSRLECDYYQVWVPGKHYVPQVSPILIQVASGESKTTVLPTQAALWGEGVTERIEACMVEPNEPGGTNNGVFYTDLPSGVTYNAGTRELTVNVTTPGRLNIGRYVSLPGCSTQVHRIAVEVGPVIRLQDFTVTQGAAVNVDVYAAVDCGILTTDGTNKAKTITVTGLPAGLSYDDATGLITGTTTAATGPRTLVVTGTNSVGQQATKNVTLSVVAAPSAGAYAYQSLSGLVGSFDASRDASFTNATGDVPTWANAVSGAGDLSKPSGVTPVPQRVANVLGGKPIVRFTKGSDGGTSTVLESAQSVSVAGPLNGGDTPFTLVFLAKALAGSGTGSIAGWSEQVSSSAARNATTVRRSGSASSFRYGATTATSADVSLGTLADETWYLIVQRHNGGNTSDAWVNKTRVLTAAAHSSSSLWTGTARFSIGNVQGSTSNASRYPSTAFAGDVAEILAYSTALSDADITQMMNDLYTKWGLS